MEVLSLLKYWRGGGGGYPSFATGKGMRPAFPITTISTSAIPPAEEESSDDDGPFFDLEFAVPEDESDGARLENDAAEEGLRDEPGEEALDDEREFDLTLTSETMTSTDLASPSDELFFKGRFGPHESSSVAFTHSESGSKSQMLPVSLLRTKLRVLMLGLRKQKDHTGAAAAVDSHSGSVTATISSPKHPSQRQGKLFTVKFKVEEVPIVSLFTRDNSSRNAAGINGKPPKQQTDDCGEKKPSKELVQKYLGKIKPLYVRVSKRQGERSRFSGQLNSEQVLSKEVEKREDEDGSSPLLEELPPSRGSPKTVQKQNQSGAIPAGLRVVCKHLGKSRSASAAVAAVPSPPPAAPRRRDDSLLQLQDGIQSAIAHCKMSLSVSKEPEAPTDCGEKAREDFT